MPSLCKVGITDNLAQRLNDLNKTGVPTRFQVYDSYELENAEIMEQEVLSHFAEKRLNKKREFIEEHPERICDYIREHKNSIKVIEESKSKFEKAGIPVGEKLVFYYDEPYNKIVAEVLQNGKIKFDGKETSLSNSAKEILKKHFNKDWKAVQGTIFWSYKGKTIREYFDQIV